ncbi:helix-turn-helix domain-containing protein [Nocardia jiangxiensis]|uniref:helix-turn-helix domain-containing protein n=1 Tax=Nocardia jiangxiensis TaxID=282685 RepID=UPI000312DBB5|nr:helix-turn-helix transcriptional regulator [Nocardia jiangxiensis]
MTGSTLARRSLGRRLRKLREAVKLSQSAASKAVELSPQSIGRLEDGQATRVSSLHINVLCNLYGASDEDRQVLLGLAQEARESSKSGGKWWRAYADEIPADFDHYVALEEAAKTLTTFQITLLPGLLQTADYRRNGIRTVHPQMSTAEVERRVELSARRQERLQDNAFELNAYLSSAVLQHRVGGPAVMARQLQHLLNIQSLPNKAIRIIPQSVGSYIGLHTGTFVLLEFPDVPSTRIQEPPVVYAEGYTGCLYLERDTEIEQFRRALADIRRVALDVGESTGLIARLARECEQ